MSESTQPHRAGPHSIDPAVIGARLNIAARGDGNEAARLLWFVVLSHTSWRAVRPTWASDVTLSHEMGHKDTDADKRLVKRALARLAEAGMVETTRGIRPAHKTRKYGRLLVPRLASPVKVLIPSRGQMTNLWITCREVRKRPASLVTLAVGLYVLAAHEVGHHVARRTKISGTMADVRRFVGARKGHAWTQRVRDLETLGLLSREDRVVYLEPTDTWDQTKRALAKVVHLDITPAKCPVIGEPPAWIDDCAPVPMDHDPQWEACEWG